MSSFVHRSAVDVELESSNIFSGSEWVRQCNGTCQIDFFVGLIFSMLSSGYV